jgi:isoleucyl-tRNA synthetase
LVEFSKVMAPFLPFLTEAIYRNLVAGKIPGAPESVHMSKFPAARSGATDEELDLKMSLVRQAVSMGRALRSRFVIKTRQPLRGIYRCWRDFRKKDLLENMESLIRRLNVRKCVFVQRGSGCLDLCKPNTRGGEDYGLR